MVLTCDIVWLGIYSLKRNSTIGLEFTILMQFCQVFEQVQLGASYGVILNELLTLVQVKPLIGHQFSLAQLQSRNVFDLQ
jgi:hypothetical protein